MRNSNPVKSKMSQAQRQAMIDFFYATNMLEKSRKKALSKKQPKSKQKS